MYVLFSRHFLNPTGIQLPWQLHGNEASGVYEVKDEKIILNEKYKTAPWLIIYMIIKIALLSDLNSSSFT